LNLSPEPLTSHGLGFSTWHAYDPDCKAELWSTLFTNSRETVLFDPIPWPKGNPMPAAPVIIVQTNANHDRFSKEMASLVHGKIESELPGFEKVQLPGAGEGETGYFHPETRTLILGDALINLASNGLGILPDKYCTDPAKLRESVRLLARLPVERIFFAHGDPIVHDGASRIRELIA
jgi:glyoxylase-like metal-dependent hydrolase (beta-lactamase superfamily II)